MTGAEQHRIFVRRLATYKFLETLPPISHWPRRPAQFRPQDSPLFAVIIDSMYKHGRLCDFVEASRILSSARIAGRIIFDPKTRLWRGARWVPDEKKQLGATNGTPLGDWVDSIMPQLKAECEAIAAAKPASPAVKPRRPIVFPRLSRAELSKILTPEDIERIHCEFIRAPMINSDSAN
jgi:hypothetical protein